MGPVTHYMIGLHSARPAWKATRTSGRSRASAGLQQSRQWLAGQAGSLIDFHISEVKWRSGKVLGASASTLRFDVAVTVTSPKMCTRVLGCVLWQSPGMGWVNVGLWCWPPICATLAYQPIAVLLNVNQLPSMFFISIRRDVNYVTFITTCIFLYRSG